MLPRQRKRGDNERIIDVPKRKRALSLVAWVVGLEIFSLGVCYLAFDRLNASSDNRRKLKNYCPSLLEGYYYVSDTLAGNKLREEDLAIWASKDNNWEENGSS